MDKVSVGSLLLLLLAGATLSYGEGGSRGRGSEAEDAEEMEELPMEALKYLGRFGHLQPPNGPFSLVDRWVNIPDPYFLVDFQKVKVKQIKK